MSETLTWHIMLFNAYHSSFYQYSHRLVGWGLTALSALIGHTVPYYSQRIITLNAHTQVEPITVMTHIYNSSAFCYDQKWEQKYQHVLP